jgi:hypothetical protein
MNMKKWLQLLMNVVVGLMLKQLNNKEHLIVYPN